jgi:hypothetical protein
MARGERIKIFMKYYETPWIHCHRHNIGKPQQVALMDTTGTSPNDSYNEHSIGTSVNTYQ